jgi:hypothetical protein
MKVSKNRNNIFRDLIGFRFSKLTHNGLQLGEGGGFLAQKVIGSTSAPILQNRCACCTTQLML